MNRNVLAGAFVGSLVTTGLLLFIKIRNINADSMEKELEDYTKKKAEDAGSSYLASNYGLTKERIDRLKKLAEAL